MTSIDVSKALVGPKGVFDLHVNFQIQPGSFVALYGESGAGKTTLLRLVSGLTAPDTGKITSSKTVWFDSSTRLNLSPQKRPVGMVFQDYALFPHLTVRQNLEYASHGYDAIDHLIEICELGELSPRKPTQLSGGQQQRVALARALCQRPKLLLLDEPLSALDNHTRYRLQKLLFRLHEEYQLTTVLVSHDISEILRLCQRVVHLVNGKIIADGEPSTVFRLHHVSGKFQFTGEVISIAKHDVIFVAEILVANELVKIVLDAHEAEQLSIGDRVVVASKAFNPIVKKIEDGND